MLQGRASFRTQSHLLTGGLQVALALELATFERAWRQGADASRPPRTTVGPYFFDIPALALLSQCGLRGVGVAFSEGHSTPLFFDPI